jgi:hypothetical protein
MGDMSDARCIGYLGHPFEKEALGALILEDYFYTVILCLIPHTLLYD